MSLPGERLIIAATLDRVEAGEIFRTLPPHMTLVSWANIQENRRFRIYAGLNNIFSNQNVYQDAVGGKSVQFGKDEKTPVHMVDNIDSGLRRRDAAHSLVKSLGYFDPEDWFADTKSFEKGDGKYLPHVSDTLERTIGTGEVISFQSIGVFAVHADDPDKLRRVLASYQLAKQAGLQGSLRLADKKVRLV